MGVAFGCANSKMVKGNIFFVGKRSVVISVSLHQTGG